MIEKIQNDIINNVKNAEDKRVYEILTQLVISGDLIKHTSSSPIVGVADNGDYTVTHQFDFTYIPYACKRDIEAKLNRTYDLLNYICDKYQINHNAEHEEMEQENE